MENRNPMEWLESIPSFWLGRAEARLQIAEKAVGDEKLRHLSVAAEYERIAKQRST